MTEFEFKIGQRVQDSVTKYKGTITARAQYSSGENGYRVEGLALTGAMLCEWIPAARIIVIDDGETKVTP